MQTFDPSSRGFPLRREFDRIAFEKLLVQLFALDENLAQRLREELLGGGDDRAGGIGTMDRRRRRGLIGRDRRKVVHEGSLGRAGTGEPAGALSDRTGSNPFRLPSSSRWRATTGPARVISNAARSYLKSRPETLFCVVP